MDFERHPSPRTRWALLGVWLTVVCLGSSVLRVVVQWTGPPTLWALGEYASLVGIMVLGGLPVALLGASVLRRLEIDGRIRLVRPVDTTMHHPAAAWVIGAVWGGSSSPLAGLLLMIALPMMCMAPDWSELPLALWRTSIATADLVLATPLRALGLFSITSAIGAVGGSVGVGIYSRLRARRSLVASLLAAGAAAGLSTAALVPAFTWWVGGG